MNVSTKQAKQILIMVEAGFTYQEAQQRVLVPVVYSCDSVKLSNTKRK